MNKHRSTTPSRHRHAPVAARTPSAEPVEDDEAGLDVVPVQVRADAVPESAAATVDLRPVRFGYFQPDAHEVFVVGSFNDWDPRATALTSDSFGDWSVQLLLAPGSYSYRFLVDGEWRDDPSAARMTPNPYGGFDMVVDV